MTTAIETKLVASDHGFDDYDVHGLNKVHRACVGKSIKNGDIFNVYCEDGVKLGATWSGSLDASLAAFSIENPYYVQLVSSAAT